MIGIEETKRVRINMGPQHPATHGVGRFILTLNGEIIEDVKPICGYLHRGLEKLAENMTYQQFMPIVDRLDYVASMNNDLAYCLAIEKLLGMEVPERAEYIRILIAELGRIASHLIWLGTMALDIGAMTPYFYTFRDRETIYDMFEEICGARLMYNYVRMGGVSNDITPKFMEMLKHFLDTFPKLMKESDGLLTKNRIWMSRTKDVGVINYDDAISWGLSGPCLRGSGVNWDLRKNRPYGIYPSLDFDIPYLPEGDVYARYLVRLEEINQSVRILRQCVEKIPSGGDYMNPESPFVRPMKKPKEGIALKDFVLQIRGVKAPAGELYFGAENPKGELGFYIVSDGAGKPYRMKIRTPSFVHVFALPVIVKGGLIADIVSVISSLDFVFGEVDR